ncbi:hypothetical protein E2C01_054979 [Portunus trituberculatus]|uniref:Uncharacterized protein n=1 Tax=Portunus trituberculatus TaxID=210409 RepID=A0A5B7GTD5_PORTR|nr:hypothetical protein [Portunus trituberculatus]
MRWRKFNDTTPPHATPHHATPRQEGSLNSLILFRPALNSCRSLTLVGVGCGALRASCTRWGVEAKGHQGTHQAKGWRLVPGWMLGCVLRTLIQRGKV